MKSLTYYCRMWKDDIRENKRAMAKLQAGAETCKHVLTSHGTATCSVESLHDGIDFQCNVSRCVYRNMSGGSQVKPEASRIAQF